MRSAETQDREHGPSQSASRAGREVAELAGAEQQEMELSTKSRVRLRFAEVMGGPHELQRSAMSR
jgi:hypothetical protein